MLTAGIRKAKRSGLSVWFGAFVIAEDEFGTWLAARTGTRVAWLHGDTKRESETVATLDIVALMPHDGWWAASWWSNRDTTVDVSLPPYFAGGIWTFEDLELDLFLTPSGTHGVVDLDEFLVACDVGQIRPEERARAIETAGEMERCLRSRAEPFGDVGWRRCKEADELDLPLLDPPPLLRS